MNHIVGMCIDTVLNELSIKYSSAGQVCRISSDSRVQMSGTYELQFPGLDKNASTSTTTRIVDIIIVFVVRKFEKIPTFHLD